MAQAGTQLDEVEVPYEPGNHFTFRNISGPELDEADLSGTKRAGAQFRDMPDRVVDAALTQDKDGAKAVRTRDQQFKGYDPMLLVKYGVHRWRGKLYEMECNEETKMTLDARTMEWAARQVFERNTRPEGEAESSESSLSTARA